MGDPFDLAAGWLQEHLLLPLLYGLGMMQWEDVSYGWALFAVYGAVQVAITFAVCMPLERWRPVERWPDARAVTVDVLYTVISRVGVLPLFTFVLFYRAQVVLNGFLADHGFVPPTLERLLPFLLGQPDTDLRHLRRHSGLCRLLAASAIAQVPLVVGIALAAPCTTTDDVLVGRPQSPAG